MRVPLARIGAAAGQQLTVNIFALGSAYLLAALSLWLTVTTFSGDDLGLGRTNPIRTLARRRYHRQKRENFCWPAAGNNCLAAAPL